ncbi:MAG: coenzyme F420-0:L-glutamate ligase [Sphingomonadales bacterium]|nr:coenzyme F420-0:L-glutamate ligase [Sphingomonadales bacterium]
MQAELRVIALSGLPLFVPGMDIACAIIAAAARQGEPIGATDAVVVAQKIVSKVEGRRVALADVAVRADGAALAARSGRPAPLVQLICDESSAILRASPAVIVTRHRSGHVLANAGIDASNVGGNSGGGEDAHVLLWPRDPDASARALRAALGPAGRPAVVIADSLGRAWRMGTLGTAIGCAGLAALHDRRGEEDLFGRPLQATVVAVADAIAAAAVLAMGEGDEGTPVAIVRGVGRWIAPEDGPGATAGLRPAAEDLFL